MGSLLKVALYLVLSRNINRRLSPVIVTTGMFLFGSLFIGVYGSSSALQTHWTGLPYLVFGMMAYVVIMGTAMPYYLNNWALSKVESSAVALYIYIQPVVSALLSHYIYKENLTPRLILASLLIFTGVAVGNLRGNHVEPRLT